MRWFLERASRLPRWKLGLLVVLVLGAAGAGVWAYTATREAGAEVQRVRWGDITLELPAPTSAADVRAVQEWYSPGMYSPDFSPDASTPSVAAIRLAKGQGPDASWVVIDATTGDLLYEQVRPEDKSAFVAVLATVQVLEAGVAADAGAPWPYGATPPSAPRQSWGNITYLEPDPASGIVVRPSISDFGPEAATKFLIVSSARSSRHINAETGGVSEDLDRVDDSDREAFDRFTSEIRLVTGEAP